jgi:hypothetical protein
MSNHDNDANRLSSDELAKTRKKEDIELSEEQLAGAAGGAVDVFLKLGDIKGE